jgi:quercetin dioxygenase-like cupin family protein
MKRTILFVIGIFLLTSLAYAGDSYYIQNTSSGITSEKAPLKFSEGEISAAVVDKMGYETAVYKFAPNTSMEVHAAEVQWIGFVISGTGKLTLAGKDKKVTSTIDFKPGDLFVMEPDTFHGWQVGNEEWISVWVRKK